MTTKNVVLRNLPDVELLIACDFIQDKHPKLLDLVLEVPYQCCYLKYAGPTHAETLATRLPHRRALVAVARPIDEENPSSIYRMQPKGTLWGHGDNDVRVRCRRVIAFRREVLEAVITFLTGRRVNCVRYMGDAWYNSIEWLRDTR